MSNQSEKSELQKLREDVRKLQFDVKACALTKSQCGFTIFNDPKKWDGEPHKGENANTVTDTKYLNMLENLLDWQASQDEQVEGDGDEAKKKRKYAFYKRFDAARCRRLVQILMAPEDEDPF